MPTNGMTIDSLNTVSSLTAQDEVPVWDKEASGEPTRKITAQNMTASVKALGSLVNASEMNNALAGKQNTLTFDTTPTTGSTNPVTSGGVANAIAQSMASITYTETQLTGDVPAGALQAFSGQTITRSGYKAVFCSIIPGDYCDYMNINCKVSISGDNVVVPQYYMRNSGSESYTFHLYVYVLWVAK